MENAAALPPENGDRRSLLRSLTESAICLLLAVLLFRTFAAEGYMISTGSMAPHLLGFHKRVTCPSCRFEFPFGIAYDTDPAGVTAAETTGARSRAVCPNCGQAAIDLADVPRNHGDQLLVYRPAYDHRPPQRWEVVVFRNPHNPLESYVKRVVGLPGERVQLIDGDVYADGALCRKDWSRQRALRITVHEHRFHPDQSQAAEPHWRTLPAQPPAVGWVEETSGFQLAAAKVKDDQAWSWVEYAHWLRQRGQHETSVALEHWPNDIEPSSIPPAGLRYDAVRHRLSCIGVLPEPVAARLLAHPADEEFHRAVRELAEQSHFSPITDEYGYNPREGDYAPTPVRDVMVALRLSAVRGAGEFAVEMTDGAANYTCVFDVGRRQIRLYAGSKPEPACQEPLPDAVTAGSCLIEMSLFDQQVLVAVNGEPALSPWTFTTPDPTPAPRYPVRFGARGLDATVSNLVLYRDVYYTGARSRNGVQAPYQLDADELFVLGDNSPVSHDSRRWSDGAVRQSLLVGKPFVVHLPSKPGRLRVGPYEMQLRLPDLERMHFLK